MKASDLQKNKNRTRRKIKEAFKPYLIASYVLCAFAFFYSVFNFRNVLINYSVPLLLAAVCGLVAIFFTEKKDNYFFAFMGYGSLFIGIPLFINNTFADFRNVEMKLSIKNRQHAQGRHRASVDIRYKDFDKEILVDDSADIDNSSYIILKMNKGLLGYYVIKSTRLVNE
ncbi:hypothetical protein AAFN85_04455 [Mucilaginibacter sp. CAU 1740]|uniref:hypothetical protein n=1 Tax=Mucilaginibacter sp. CAU 1740 TaxID=3140365 RepID=UPI00325ABF66